MFIAAFTFGETHYGLANLNEGKAQIKLKAYIIHNLMKRSGSMTRGERMRLYFPMRMKEKIIFFFFMLLDVGILTVFILIIYKTTYVQKLVNVLQL